MLLASTCSTRSMPKHSRSAQTAHGVAYAVCNNGCLADGRALKSVHLSVKSNLVAHGWAHIMYLHARTQEQGPSHLRTLYMYSCNTPPPPAVFLGAVFSALLVRALAYQNAQRTAHREISSGVEGGRGGSVVGITVCDLGVGDSASARHKPGPGVCKVSVFCRHTGPQLTRHRGLRGQKTQPTSWASFSAPHASLT
jgi:hypothetical protein